MLIRQCWLHCPIRRRRNHVMSGVSSERVKVVVSQAGTTLKKERSWKETCGTRLEHVWRGWSCTAQVLKQVKIGRNGLEWWDCRCTHKRGACKERGRRDRRRVSKTEAQRHSGEVSRPLTRRLRLHCRAFWEWSDEGQSLSCVSDIMFCVVIPRILFARGILTPLVLLVFFVTHILPSCARFDSEPSKDFAMFRFRCRFTTDRSVRTVDCPSVTRDRGTDLLTLLLGPLKTTVRLQFSSKSKTYDLHHWFLLKISIERNILRAFSISLRASDVSEHLLIRSLESTKKDGKEKTSFSQHWTEFTKTKVSQILSSKRDRGSHHWKSFRVRYFLELRRNYLVMVGLLDKVDVSDESCPGCLERSCLKSSSSFLLLLELSCATPTSDDETDLTSVVLQSSSSRAFECCSRHSDRLFPSPLVFLPICFLRCRSSDSRAV